MVKKLYPLPTIFYETKGPSRKEYWAWRMEMDMSREELMAEAMIRVAREIVEGQTDLDPEFSRILNDNFFELL